LWIVCTFGNPQGGYDVCLKEVQMEPLKPENSRFKRAYTPSSFVRLSKSRADTYLEERFSQSKKFPYVLELGDRFQFELAAPPSGGSHREAYLEAFAWEVADRVIEIGKIGE